MAGFWPQSLNQRFDANGRLIIGARAYFYRSGTTTPLTVYRDYGLSDAHPNPIETNGEGAWPAVFFDEDDEFYDVRFSTPTGFNIGKYEGLPIIGPSGGGGGGGGGGPEVDPDALMKTGDVKLRYGSGPVAGFVRANGRTIGSQLSGATERANAATQPLYEFLWSPDTTLQVIGGRGANATADFTANKPLTLPDFRSRALVGLGSMGSTAASLFTPLSLGGVNADKLGGQIGTDGIELTVQQMPAHSHGASASGAGGHSHDYYRTQPSNILPAQGDLSNGPRLISDSQSGTVATTAVGNHSHTITISDQGGGARHPNVQPSMFLTVLIRL